MKEVIEEKNFAKGEDDATVTVWSKVYESQIEKADQGIKLLKEQMKIMNDGEREKKITYEHEKNVAFELELLERKAKLQEELDKSKQDEGKQSSSQPVDLNCQSCPSLSTMVKLKPGYHFGVSLNQRSIQQTYLF